MSINTIIGQSARGKHFFQRPKIIKNLWTKVETGSNVLLSAPRRVGKTSLLNYFEDNPKSNFRAIYIITESVYSEHEFFRKLYSHVFELLDGVNKFSERIKNIVGQKEIKEITKDGIKLEGKELDYYNSLLKLFENLDLGGEKLVVMVDEFAQTVQNIITAQITTKTKTAAAKFLQRNRDLRHTAAIKDKVQFIYAGSIGLENVVGSINASSTINDLVSFKLLPLTRSEAKSLVYDQILNGCEMTLKEEQYEYLLDKIEWLVPFYIQLILDETYNLFDYEGLEEVTNDTIEDAIDNAIAHRNYFDPWITRLRISFSGHEMNFIKEVLNIASEQETIESNVIYDIATKHDVTEKYKEIIKTLMYDGYINNNDDPTKYRFNSPILKRWWYKYEAN